MKSASTRSIAIDAPPAAVLDVIGDGARLPEWAPGFAPAVRPDGDLWVIDTGDSELKVRLRVDRESGTVDILRAVDERVGAFSRVVPNGEGSEFLFTLLFDEGTDQAAIDAQMEIVDAELAAVRALVES
jgi:hypothetical protein